MPRAPRAQGAYEPTQRPSLQDTIFAGLRKHAQDAAALLAELDARAFGMQQAANEEEELKRSLAQPLKKPPTKPRPFNLTRPKPPKLPTPRRIEQAIAAKPMPQDLDDVTLAGLEQEAALRKERARREVRGLMRRPRWPRPD